nr:MAG TPA: Tripartite tricarboxylate transporter TctA family [Caudoviricetes sp.]
MAKKIQTDYTRGGHDISNTAVPYYQQTLTNMNDYNTDPTQYIDKYLKYYNDTAQQSDFLRNYNRAMANATNRNYSATGGGYSSSGQRAYDDNQRYWNDEASRLSQANTSAAARLAQNYFSNNLSASEAFNKAYNTGKEYSDIEQYNNLAKQYNSLGNQLRQVGGSALSAAGSIVGAIPGVGTAVGAGLGLLGAGLSNSSVDGLASAGLGSSVNNSNMFGELTNTLGNSLGAYLKQGNSNRFTDWLGGKNLAKNVAKGAGNSVGGAIGNAAVQYIENNLGK